MISFPPACGGLRRGGTDRWPERRTAASSLSRRARAVNGDGNNDNEVKAQDRHLKAQVAAGDETHREAHDAMRGRWKRPVSGLGWYRDVKREFAALPDDVEARDPRTDPERVAP